MKGNEVFGLLYNKGGTGFEFYPNKNGRNLYPKFAVYRFKGEKKEWELNSRFLT